MDAIRSSETSVHTISTQRHIPEDDILPSHRRENHKSYTMTVYVSLFKTYSFVEISNNLLIPYNISKEANIMYKAMQLCRIAVTYCTLVNV
jgi:hypothetical protein